MNKKSKGFVGAFLVFLVAALSFGIGVYMAKNNIRFPVEFLQGILK